MTEFFGKSMAIANDYIQSIVFLDDKAYQEESSEEFKQHDFSASKVTKTFAKESKICAVYKPNDISDIEDFKMIANKADVVVLDWQINLNTIVSVADLEKDDDDEPRGLYTIPIIKDLILEGEELKNSLKLIVVYTGDYTILETITQQIFDDLSLDYFGFSIDNDNCRIESNSIRISIRAKEIEFNTETLREKYESKCIPYENLSCFILEEFTELTAGLLSNFSLLSLTTLRKNSSKILSLFSKEMDNAYLSHKSLLPSQEDAEDLLIELFGDTISDLLFYNKTNETVRDLIKDWVQVNINEEEFELLYKTGKSYDPVEKYSRSQGLLIELLNSSNKDILKRYSDVFNSIGGISKTKMKDSYEQLSLNNTSLFLNNEQQNSKEEIDKKFSKLTHHKSLFIPHNAIPKLTLGTVIKSTSNNENYYICIQQKCDSVRIPNNAERKFLFIPLIVSDSKFDILTPEGIKLKKLKDSFSIRTIKFVCKDDKGVIKAEQDENGFFVFKQKYDDEQFEWILDLKDLHSQRIIIEYTSQLSRVGLDESEWHRRYLS